VLISSTTEAFCYLDFHDGASRVARLWSTLQSLTSGTRRLHESCHISQLFAGIHDEGGVCAMNRQTIGSEEAVRCAIINGTVVLPDRLLENGMVEFEGSDIVAVGHQQPRDRSVRIIDAEGGYISPGYIDIHVHGGAGADFMDGTPEAVRIACEAHARHGTTTIFPTTTTGSFQHIMAMIGACEVVGREFAGSCGPTLAGVHLYGPYFAEDKVGCHSKDGCRPPECSEYEKYFGTEQIRVATCAAELPGADSFYALARQYQSLITCGHSNSSWTEMQKAFDAGMRHVDHFWCAMSSVPSMRQRFNVPMQGSMAEFVLMNPEMSTEVIADGCHLAPELLEFAWRMKGAARLCLVTDSNRAMDMPPGDYIFGHTTAGTLFRSDGRVGWAPGGSLASSIMGMDHMVRHMKSSTSASLPEVIRMASLTPAERTGIAHQTGSLQTGKRADVLLLDQDLQVKSVLVSGKRFL
jgi:N-acetylglucosamine-6-phosphate deacetylase